MTTRAFVPSMASCVGLGLCLLAAPRGANAASAPAVSVQVDEGARPRPPIDPPAELPSDAAGPDAAEPVASEDPSEADEASDAAPSPIVDTVLPCGLRVITARDASLPVAAVVLAIEVGTRDDPAQLPGLVHALAYHLQQGNRELAPGEAIATAHDVGGLAGMAVGAAQVRFESLVPLSQLDAQLRVESQRLRAPTINHALWLKSLSYARNDDAVKALLPREAAASAWQDPGMAHDGRRVGKGLADMLEQAIGAQLGRLYDYRSATLVIVGPEAPEALLARVEPLFAGLPPRARKVLTAPATPPATGAAPRVARLPGQAGDSLVWAVPGTPSARAWAQVLCGTINRQERGQQESSKAQVRCTYSDDPRRPLLHLRAVGFAPEQGPEALIAARLERIAASAATPGAEPELTSLIEAQRARIASYLEYGLRTPLELASYLASANEGGAAPGDSMRERASMIGLPVVLDDPSPALDEAEGAVPSPEDAAEPGAALDEGAPPPATVDARAALALLAAIPELLDTRRAVLLLDEDAPVPPPVHAEPPPGMPAPSESPAEPAEPKTAVDVELKAVPISPQPAPASTKKPEDGQ